MTMSESDILKEISKKNEESKRPRVVLNCTKAELLEEIRVRVEWVQARIDRQRRADDAGLNAFMEKWGNTPIRAI